MTRDEFIKHEIAVWGEDHVFDLIDNGYVAVELSSDSDNGKITWRWILTGTPTPYRSSVDFTTA